MKRYLLIVGCLFFAAFTLQAQTDTWNEFAKTKFEPKFHEEFGEYIFYPTFPPTIKAMEGKEVTIEGFYVPFAPEDGNYIILSKFPMSQCFFCGGGGPESIAEVYFAKNPGQFQVDDVITVKGKLKLNAKDMDHMTFIVEQAVLIKK